MSSASCGLLSTSCQTKSENGISQHPTFGSGSHAGLKSTLCPSSLGARTKRNLLHENNGQPFSKVLGDLSSEAQLCGLLLMRP